MCDVESTVANVTKHKTAYPSLTDTM